MSILHPVNILCKQGRKVHPARSPGGVLLCGLILVSLMVGRGVLAQTSSVPENPRLSLPRGVLNQPLDDPIFLVGFLGLGGGLDYDQGQLGYGGAILFRPGSASRFLAPLYDWRTALLLQADYQKVSGENRIFSGDLVLRRYLDSLDELQVGASPFMGAGLGASEVELPAGAGARFQKGWSFLLEIGQEWTIRQKSLAFVKAQYRHYRNEGYNFSTWSVQAGLGLALP